MTVHDARAALEALAVNRQVILDPKTREIWMAGPFSAVPTRFRVHGAKASWWANCAWDMFGIPAALGQSARIDATCADCDAPFQLDVDRDKGPKEQRGIGSHTASRQSVVRRHRLYVKHDALLPVGRPSKNVARAA